MCPSWIRLWVVTKYMCEESNTKSTTITKTKFLLSVLCTTTIITTTASDNFMRFIRFGTFVRTFSLVFVILVGLLSLGRFFFFLSFHYLLLFTLFALIMFRWIFGIGCVWRAYKHNLTHNTVYTVRHTAYRLASLYHCIDV